MSQVLPPDLDVKLWYHGYPNYQLVSTALLLYALAGYILIFLVFFSRSVFFSSILSQYISSLLLFLFPVLFLFPPPSHNLYIDVFSSRFLFQTFLLHLHLTAKLPSFLQHHDIFILTSQSSLRCRPFFPSQTQYWPGRHLSYFSHIDSLNLGCPNLPFGESGNTTPILLLPYNLKQLH